MTDLSETQLFIVSGIAGALLGLTYFWALWATLKYLKRAQHPAILMLSSLLLRFGLVLMGFYFLIRYIDWQQVLTAAIGFTLARLLLVQRIRPSQIKKEQDI